MEHSNNKTSYNPTPQKIVNTINLDQKQPLVEPTLGKHPNLFDAPHQSMTEEGKMSLNTWFTKPVVFQPNLTWATTDAVNTTLFTTTLVSILQSVPTPGYLSLSGNAFFRSGINIDLRVSASPFHAGKLILSFIPPQVDLTYRETVYAKAMFPSVFIDAGNNTHGILHIPFIAIKDFFATQNPDSKSDLGSIRVTVLNPLAIGTGGSPQVTYSLSMNPTENDLNVPVHSHNVRIQSLIDAPGDVIGDLLGLLKGEFNQDFRQGLHALGMDKLMNILSHSSGDLKTAKILHDIINNNSNQPSVPPQPPAPDIPSGTTNVPVMDASAPSLANKSGLTAEHLSLTPEQSDMHANDQSKDLKEMDLKIVARTPSLLQICNYNGSNVVNDRLFTCPIGPYVLPGRYAVGGGTPAPGLIVPTYLQHATFPFAFWRGSIDLHFSFAATEQHKGKVIVAYLPNDTLDVNGVPTITPMTVTDLSVYPNEVFDLSMNRDFTFKIPYNTETEYKENRNGFIQPFDGTTPITQSNLRTTTGTVVMLVYNRLTYPGTVTPNVQFNVFISAGEDFDFHGLRDPVNNIFPTSYIQIQSSLDVIYESSLEGMKMEKANHVGVRQGFLSRSTYQADPDEIKLDKLLSRYYPQFAYTIGLAPNASRSVVITSTPGQVERAARSANNNDPIFRNLITHYKQLYAFWCGSLNQFIIHNTTVNNPIVLTVTHIPNQFNSTTTAYPNPMTNTSDAVAGFIYANSNTGVTDLSLSSLYSHVSNIRVNPTIEITTPHRSKFRRLYPQLLNPNVDTNSTGALYLRYSNQNPDGLNLSAVVYQSIGDDFRFKYLVPALSQQIIANQ